MKTLSKAFMYVYTTALLLVGIILLFTIGTNDGDAAFLLNVLTGWVIAAIIFQCLGGFSFLNN